MWKTENCDASAPVRCLPVWPAPDAGNPSRQLPTGLPESNHSSPFLVGPGLPTAAPLTVGRVVPEKREVSHF